MKPPSRLPLKLGSSLGNRSSSLLSAWAITVYVLKDKEANCWYLVLNHKVLDSYHSEEQARSAHTKLVAGLSGKLNEFLQGYLKPEKTEKSEIDAYV